jgi:hypothetical protein
MALMTCIPLVGNETGGIGKSFLARLVAEPALGV